MIGGADGPTSVFLAGTTGASGKKKKKAAEYRRMLDQIAKEIEPGEKSMAELVQYIRAHYNGHQAGMSDRREKMLKQNIFHACYAARMDESLPAFPKDRNLSPEQWQKWIARREEAVDKIIEDAGNGVTFELECYEFPMMIDGREAGRFQVELDYISGYVSSSFQCTHGENKKTAAYVEQVMRDIQLYRGVSRKDIEERSSRFLEYAATLIYYRNKKKRR